MRPCSICGGQPCSDGRGNRRGQDGLTNSSSASTRIGKQPASFHYRKLLIPVANPVRKSLPADQRLLELTARTSLQEELHNFLQTELSLLGKLCPTSSRNILPRMLPFAHSREEELILSPSDFGFHNTLLASDGALKFFDFEYAGWDDPAKTAADFLRQPRHYIPSHLWWDFLASLAPLFPDASRFYQQVRILHPFTTSGVVLHIP